jgi:hypothetical protein
MVILCCASPTLSGQVKLVTYTYVNTYIDIHIQIYVFFCLGKYLYEVDFGSVSQRVMCWYDVFYLFRSLHLMCIFVEGASL